MSQAGDSIWFELSSQLNSSHVKQLLKRYRFVVIRKNNVVLSMRDELKQRIRAKNLIDKFDS